MKKIFTLLTLLVMCVTGTWADPTASLIDHLTGNVNTTTFKTTSTTSSVSYTFEDMTFLYAITPGGSLTTPIGAYQMNKIIRYDVLTNSVTVDVYAYNRHTSTDYKLYISMVEEGDEVAGDIDIVAFTVDKNSGKKCSHTFTPTTNASIYVFVESTYIDICQEIITDNGATTFKQGGEIGYSVNLTLCRIGSDKVLTTMDGIEYNNTDNNVKVLTSGNPQKFKTTTNYIKFTLSATEKVSINASGTYSVTTNNSYQSASSVSGNQEMTLDAGTYYICPNGSNVTFASLSFLAPPALHTVTYKAGRGTGDDVVDAAATIVADCPVGFTAPTGESFIGWNTESNGSGAAYAVGATVSSDLTLYAQWAKTAQKILYSLTDGIGSATVTAAEATVTASSLVLANTNGRIKLTAKSGETFMNGDNITFSGVVGNTAKNYGVKYGSTTSINAGSVYVAGTTTPLSASGTLSLGSSSNDLYIGRYDGTGTTLNYCVISRTTPIMSEAFSGVKKNYSALTADAGTNGYTISTNTITLSGDILYTAAPTDITLTKHVVFTDASEDNNDVPVTFDGTITDGYYIGTATINETVYTVRAKACVSVPVGATGWSTYSTDKALDFTGLEIEAYQVTGYVGTAIEKEQITGTVAANTGLLVKGTPSTSYNVPVVASGTNYPGNMMVESVSGGTVNAGEYGVVNYVLMNDGSGNAVFKWIGSTPATLGANKAYLSIPGGPTPAGARGLEIDGDVTAIKNIKVGTEDNVYYDLNGRRVLYPTKGLYIVNGKKIVVK